MFRYDEFILESQLDSISESILYFSPKLRKLFKKLSMIVINIITYLKKIFRKKIDIQ